MSSDQPRKTASGLTPEELAAWAQDMVKDWPPMTEEALDSVAETYRRVDARMAAERQEAQGTA